MNNINNINNISPQVESRNVKLRLDEEGNRSISGGEAVHQCEVCDKYFSSKSNVERHQRSQHNMTVGLA